MNQTTIELLAVAVGGAVGATARYFLSGWMQQKFPQFEPAGTLLVNVLGCLLIGLLVAIEIQQGGLGVRWLRAFAITGLLGSLTTYSTFGYQTVALIREAQLSLALLNVIAQLVLGLSAVFLGLIIGQMWTR